MDGRVVNEKPWKSQHLCWPLPFPEPAGRSSEVVTMLVFLSGEQLGEVFATSAFLHSSWELLAADWRLHSLAGALSPGCMSEKTSRGFQIFLG